MGDPTPSLANNLHHGSSASKTPWACPPITMDTTPRWLDASWGAMADPGPDCLDRAFKVRRVRLFTVTFITRTLAEGDPLVGSPCPDCKLPFRVGEAVVIEPRQPARHENCATTN